MITGGGLILPSSGRESFNQSVQQRGCSGRQKDCHDHWKGLPMSGGESFNLSLSLRCSCRQKDRHDHWRGVPSIGGESCNLSLSSSRGVVLAGRRITGGGLSLWIYGRQKDRHDHWRGGSEYWRRASICPCPPAEGLFWPAEVSLEGVDPAD